MNTVKQTFKKRPQSPSILLQILRTRIPNPILINRKQTITLWQTRTIINLTNPRLPPPLFQTQPRRTRVRNNITPNGFLRVRIEHRRRPAIDLRDNLIGNDDRDPKFVRQALERAHEFRKVRLTGRELAAAGEIGAVQRSGAVDNEKRKARLAHHLGSLVEELELVIRVVGAGVRDIVEDFFAVETVAVGDGEAADGAESPLGVDVEAFSFAAAHVEGELTGDGEGVADLGLAGAEFAEEFGHGAGFDATG